MKRVLVVGESSYIARSFKSYTDRLHAKDGWQIEMAGARNQAWKTVDFHGYDAVLHAAAIVHQKEAGGLGGSAAFRRGIKAAQAREIYRRVNYEIALAVAAKAKESGVQQFIFLSTMAVYGNMEGCISMDTKEAPVTYYGIYKHMAERDLQNDQSESFRVAIVRPPMVYGGDCKGNFARLARLAAVCPFFPKIANKRSMIYIDNLCEYLYLIIKKEISGLGCPQNEQYIETTDLYQRIRAVQGKKTICITELNPLIELLRKKGNFLDKLFGDCYYDLEKASHYKVKDGWLGIELEEYQVVGYKDSVERSMRRSKGNYL